MNNKKKKRFCFHYFFKYPDLDWTGNHYAGHRISAFQIIFQRLIRNDHFHFL